MAAEWIPPLANEIPIKNLQIPFGYWQLSIPTCQRRRTTCLGLRRCVISTCLLTFLDSTLWDLLFYVIKSCNMGWGGASNVHVDLLTWEFYVVRSSCNFKHPECYVVRSSLAMSNILNATLWDLFCSFQHPECYVVRFALAISSIQNATLWDLLLHFLTYIRFMLQLLVFSFTS